MKLLSPISLLVKVALLSLACVLLVSSVKTRAYRKKRACNAPTTKFLLLLKLTFTPTRMWHHEKSIKSLQAWLQTMDAANERHTRVGTAIISSPLGPLTRGRDSDFSGISGGCQVTGRLDYKVVACCWRSGWEHFSSNNRQTVTDRPGMKMLRFARDEDPLLQWPWWSVA